MPNLERSNHLMKKECELKKEDEEFIVNSNPEFVKRRLSTFLFEDRLERPKLISEVGQVIERNKFA